MQDPSHPNPGPATAAVAPGPFQNVQALIEELRGALADLCRSWTDSADSGRRAPHVSGARYARAAATRAVVLDGMDALARLLARAAPQLADGRLDEAAVQALCTCLTEMGDLAGLLKRWLDRRDTA